MFKDVAPNLRLFIDYGSRAVRVAVNVLAGHPQFKPQWREAAQFRTAEEWAASPYAARIFSQQTKDDLMWFWIDMDVTNQEKPRDQPGV